MSDSLLTSFSRLVDIDDFISQLWSVHLKVKKEGYVQVLSVLPVRLYLNLHLPSP